MNKTTFKLILFSFFIFITFEAKAGRLSADLVEELKRAVISIKIMETRKAYGHAQTCVGTGFLVDKEKGIILTNRHNAAVDSPANYEATWEDGSVTDLNLIWNDPTNDFAFLKVNVEKIPTNVPQIKFSRNMKIGEDVCIIGNNDGMGHSVQEGTISDLFDFAIIRWRSQTVSINLNTKGGSSGSPIFNEKGEVIGLHYGGSDTNASAIPIAYIEDALGDIRQGKTPARFSTGALFDVINLDHAKDYYQYNTQEDIKSFLKNIPGARNRILQVNSLLPGAQLLEAGDIIDKVNGKNAGPDYYALEKAVNHSEGKPVNFTVCRNGEFLNLEVPIFDLNASLCSKMVIFGGAVFANVDPLKSFQTGMPIGSVCLGNKEPGSLFGDIYQIRSDIPPFVQIQKIMGKPVKKLEDLISILPEISKIKKFNYSVKDYSFMPGNNDILYTRQKEQSFYAYYKPEQYSAAVMIAFDKERREWTRQTLDQ